MTITLNTINSTHKTKSSRRVGRGQGSGSGKTCGRGHNGAKSRSGYSRRVAFEGGQTSLFKSIPKKGFKSWKKQYQAIIKSSDVNLIVAQSQPITLESLKQLKLIKNKTKYVKILKDEKLNHNVELPKNIKMSKSLTCN